MSAATTDPCEVSAEASEAAARWVWVKIDLERLRSNLSPRKRGRAGDAELRRWLARSGFQPRGDWWLATQANLGQLAPSEIEALEPVEPAPVRLAA